MIRNSLNVSENSQLVNIMNGFANVKHQKIFTTLLNMFYEQLCEIKPRDFYPYLLQKECLRFAHYI